MPFIEVTLPEYSPQQRLNFATRLTEAFSRIGGFPADILAVHMHCYPLGESRIVVNNRYLQADEPQYVHIAVFSPRLKKTVKRGVIDAFTTATRDVFAGACGDPVVHLNEHCYDNIGVNGKMLSELYPELAERPFYYSTAE